MPSPKNRDLTGQKFGRWKCLSKLPERVKNCWQWNCECECGVKRNVNEVDLIRGSSKSCGCLMRDQRTTHGISSKFTYHTWRAAKKRCQCKTSPMYPYYGGRGIQMCRGWSLSFSQFFGDMGMKPTPQHSIDRIDNDAHYSCGHCQQCKENGWFMNCRWATSDEQSSNRRSNTFIEHSGERLTVSQWAKIKGVKVNTLLKRIELGWSIDDCLNKEIGINKRAEYDFQRKTRHSQANP